MLFFPAFSEMLRSVAVLEELVPGVALQRRRHQPQAPPWSATAPLQVREGMRRPGLDGGGGWCGGRAAGRAGEAAPLPREPQSVAPGRPGSFLLCVRSQ